MSLPLSPAATGRPPRSAFLESVRGLAATPLFLPLFAASVLIGFRDSMSLPYMPLFAVERAHLPPFEVGAFLTLRAAGAIVISLLFGAWFDRRPSLWPLIISLALGSLGWMLMTATTDFTRLCLIGALPQGAGSAAFPLIFAVAKAQAARSDAAAARSVSLLRASFSLAWGVGPAVGALIVREDNYAALFWVSSAFSVLALAPLATNRMSTAAPVAAVYESPRLGAPVALAASSLTLFSMALAMAAIALPIAITADFGGTKGDLGLAASVCALLEVPVMMAIAARPALFSGYRGMVLGLVATALFMAAAALAPSVPAMIAAQVLRAVGIGFVSCIGISYLQDLMPGRAGAASVLYANTNQIGVLLAGLAAGGWAEIWDYRSMFWPCAAISVGALACLAAGRRR